MELLRQRTERNLFVRNETVTLDTEDIDKEKMAELISRQASFDVDDILISRQRKNISPWC